MAVALGPAFSGVFCTSDTLWERLRLAGLRTGDRFWRMPFDDVYTKMTSKSTVADLVNSAGREGGACTAAAFLREFVSPLPKSSSGEGVLDQNTAADGDESEAAERFVSYAHVDIAGTMHSSNSEGYQFQGMSGAFFPRS
ncbi:MAG: cytosol aminopeptidase-like protein [Olpidium bornovanus]|uniref:Cytosol aminopeptidase-like protein n=1 Tax=Olpidium bornovanus TaxID=278681 RepID=A0A8H7ZMU3_9FUNG|nr:MAG: cytosol aminopeptidase-like protein [Olpidium bornovanus]